MTRPSRPASDPPRGLRALRPRRHPGLPPGQRLLAGMPRFSDRPHVAPPRAPSEPTLQLRLADEVVAEVTVADLDALGPREMVSDFHCVTGWSVLGLRWFGVPLAELLAAGAGGRMATFALAHGLDRQRAAFTWDDLTAADVLLATGLDGAPLDARHGAPLRLVSPGQYGYKNVKHLARIDLLAAEPRPLSKQHLRARVALEERHPRYPARLVRWPYRLTIAPTAVVAERALDR